VLLVDELDCVLTRKQEVIYNLFEWPTRKHARLVVLGIANTMDLPQRLTPRVSSRLGLKRIVFKAYTREQLVTIVQARLRDVSVFDADAVKYCSSGVAAVSGDCRTMLQICRRSLDVALKRWPCPSCFACRVKRSWCAASNNRGKWTSCRRRRASRST